MKICVFNDPHVAARPPASRKSNYTECILNKLREIVDFANDQVIDVLACTGDWFIPKRPEATPYWLTAEITDILLDVFYRVTAIGNHDVEACIDSFKRSPLYLLCKAANIDYYEQSGIVHTNYGEGVEIAVVNYDKGATAEGIWEVSKAFRPDTPIKIMIVHGPIVPSSFNSIYPQAFLDKSIKPMELVGCCDFLFYGDIHDPHGIYRVTDLPDESIGYLGESTTFCNLGSISRNSAHELNRDRLVQVALFDTKTMQITPVELENVLPMNEVFRVEDLQREKQNEAEIDNFVSALDPQSLSFKILTKDEVKSRIYSDRNLSDVEKQLALGIIDKQ